MDRPPILQPPLPDLVFVEGGTFTMGDGVGDLWDACRPTHEVKVSSFYIAKFQVTQRLWQAVMGENPSRSNGPRRPVENVSWNDTQGFFVNLNSLEDVQTFLRQLDPPGTKFRLPTEAEWEFAARGGKYEESYLYSGSSNLKQVGWYDKNSDNETKEVGLRLANELGIYDMSGNVREWCHDRYGSGYYEFCDKKGTVENPQGPEEGADRVRRGGGYLDDAGSCRPASRSGDSPGYRSNYYGFRLAVPLQSAGQPVPAYP